MSAPLLSSREQAVFGHFPPQLWVGSFWPGSAGTRGPESSRYSVAAEMGSSAEQGWRSAVSTGLCCCSAGPDLGLAPEVTGPLACSDWVPGASVAQRPGWVGFPDSA